MVKQRSSTASAAGIAHKVRPVARVVPHHADSETWAGEGGPYQQWLSRLEQQLDSIQPGRIVRVDLIVDELPAVSTAATAPAAPRYTVTICDHQLAVPSTASELSCGVLILSQGREHDWLFSHAEGQQSLCRQHRFHRLLLVALNRGHSFSSLQAVQDEVRASVSSLLPTKERRGAVPFLALSADIGGRREVALLPTDANGPVVVEDVREPDGTWIRRLLFIQIGMVQSEARLVAAKATAGRPPPPPPPMSAPIDFAYLPSGYHRSFLAALSLLPSPPSSILLIGVGAGSLAMFLSCVLPLCSLTLVELDGAILRAAESHFGFLASARMTVRVMDGLDYIASTAAAVASDASGDSGLYDVVCVDCNSGDLSSGLTFPPPAFVSAATLSATHSLCRPSSLYLLNFGCRSAAKRDSVLRSLLERWDELYEVDVGEADTTNTVLAARRVERSVPATAAPVTVSVCLSRVINKRRVSEWRRQATEGGELLRPFEWDEQMDLSHRCSSMQHISRQPGTQHSGQESASREEGDKREAGDSPSERWQLITQSLPLGDGEGAVEAGAEESAGGAELSAVERKRAKARAKRARQKASQAKDR